jgi:hypothetical protein
VCTPPQAGYPQESLTCPVARSTKVVVQLRCDAQSALDEQRVLQSKYATLEQRVLPSTRLIHPVQLSPQVLAHVSQVPSLQVGVAPVPQVPHSRVPPQPSGHEPQVLPRCSQVSGVQQLCSKHTSWAVHIAHVPLLPQASSTVPGAHSPSVAQHVPAGQREGSAVQATHSPVTQIGLEGSSHLVSSQHSWHDPLQQMSPSPHVVPVNGVQVPSPLRLHTSHGPSQALSQQTSSTQWPDAHCPPWSHGAPFSPSPTHWPPRQNESATQSGSSVQLVAQALPRHWA